MAKLQIANKARKFSGERRVDVGEYRVIYVNSGDTVDVLAVGKRNDDEVYKSWERIS
jgi:mRNA interferase RelE/StbE